MVKVCNYFESKACVEIYIKSIKQPYTIVCDTLEAAIIVCDEITQQLQEEKHMNEWISVKERLLERNCEVLAYYGFEREGSDDLGYMSMGVLAYYAYDKFPHFQHESTGVRVTHWMPLPAAPKEVE